MTVDGINIEGETEILDEIGKYYDNLYKKEEENEIDSNMNFENF